jgi:hypothetical protein
MKIKTAVAAAFAQLLHGQAFAANHVAQPLVANDVIVQVLKMLQEIAANAISNLR